MTNAVTTTTAGNQPAVRTTGNAFTKAAAAMGAREGEFLKFDGNTGDFTYGPKDNSEELAHGTHVVVDMFNAKLGWICWKEGAVVDELNIRLTDLPNGELPAEDTLKDHGPYAPPEPDEVADGWHKQSVIELRSEEDGTLFTYKTSSESGKRSVAALTMNFGKKMSRHPNQLPIVEIGATKFDAKNSKGKTRGTKYAPTFEIIGWMTIDAFEDLADGADEAAAAAEAAAAEGDGSDNPENYKAEGTEAAAASTEAPAEGGRRGKRF